MPKASSWRGWPTPGCAVCRTSLPEHLQNQTFILPEQISGYAPQLGPQPGGLVAVIALVSLGQGMAVVPESVVGHVSLPNVVYRPIKGSEACS